MYCTIHVYASTLFAQQKKNTNILATIFTMEKNAESKFFPLDSVGKRVFALILPSTLSGILSGGGHMTDQRKLRRNVFFGIWDNFRV